MNRLFLSIGALFLSVSLSLADEPTQKPGPKLNTYAGEYAEMSTPIWQTSFPYIGSYEILAPSTGDQTKPGAYNCISHTLKVYDQWVWPGYRVEDFDRLYAKYGFRRIRTLDYRFRTGEERIVLYGKIYNDGRIECTHGCKQLADGSWTSKLGAGPLIRHSVPESLTGPSYGQPIAVYVRPRKLLARILKAKPKPAETIPAVMTTPGTR